MVLWAAILGVVAGLRSAPLRVGPSRRCIATALAPRSVLEEEFAALAADGARLKVDLAAQAPVIAELVADGDLEVSEVAEMGAVHADASATLDVEGFVKLCLEIDDLFEEDDDDDDEAAAAAAPAAPAWPRGKGAGAAAVAAPVAAQPVAAAKPAAAAPKKKALTPLEALLEALPAKCAYPDEESGETYDTGLVAAIEAVAALRDETARSDEELAELLESGEWSLRFTSSPSFAFNKGFTGVAGTLPGGAAFDGLRQTVSSTEGANSASYTEVVIPKLGGEKPLDVYVSADWALKRRFDALARSNKVYLDAVGQSVKYGPVSVDGQRVTRGWKAMRVMNSLSIEYIDATVRVMKGTTAWFVFTKVE